MHITYLTDDLILQIIYYLMFMGILPLNRIKALLYTCKRFYNLYPRIKWYVADKYFIPMIFNHIPPENIMKLNLTRDHLMIRSLHNYYSSRLVNLTHLIIHNINNESNSIIRNAISNLPNLVYLDCSHSPSFCPRECADYLPLNPRLTYLDCSGTNISEFNLELPALRELYCQKTKIRRIPATFTNLRILRCDNCEIRGLPTTLVNLEKLSIKNNVVFEIPDTLTNLVRLDVRFTAIDWISPKFTKLRLLRYSMPITIPDSLLKNGLKMEMIKS